MEGPNAVDLQVLRRTTSANSTTTPIQSGQLASSALPERVTAEQAVRSVEATQPGILSSVSNSEPAVSNETNGDRISPLPEINPGDLKNYLQRRARSDHQSKELYHHYMTFKNETGIDLFNHLLCVNHIGWANLIADRHLRTKFTFAELLEALGRVLLQPSLNPWRLWCVYLYPTSKTPPSPLRKLIITFNQYFDQHQSIRRR